MYAKNINPHFQTVGKRVKLDGYLAELHDGEMLIHSQVYDTYSQAEQALDTLVFELLSGLAEQGLVDSVPAAMVAEGVTSHQIPSWPREMNTHDLIVEAATLRNAIEDMCGSIGMDHNFDNGPLSPASMRYHARLSRILAKSERRLMRREFAELNGYRYYAGEPPADILSNDCPETAAPSLYERIVAECQTELDARPVVMVVDVDQAA